MSSGVIFWETLYYKRNSALADYSSGTAGLRHRSPGAATAAKFIAFVASPQGQKIIQDYGKDKYGEGLYNDAAYAKQYDE